MAAMPKMEVDITFTEVPPGKRPYTETQEAIKHLEAAKPLLKNLDSTDWPTLKMQTHQAWHHIDAALAALAPRKLEWQYRPTLVYQWAADEYAIMNGGVLGLFTVTYQTNELCTKPTLPEAQAACQAHADANPASEQPAPTLKEARREAQTWLNEYLAEIRRQVEALVPLYAYKNNQGQYENGRSNGGNNALDQVLAIIDAH